MARHQKRKKPGVGELRIIGGDFRGRKLPVLDAEGLRPTSDRVRETLFNWLQFDVPGANCLDLFSGAGSLAFEALSRGAKQVTLLELNPSSAQQLKHNLKTLQINNAEVIQGDTLQWLVSHAEQPYDILFLDPPFSRDLVQKAIDLMFDNQYVYDDSMIYIEQEKSLEWPELPTGWICHREKTTSQVRFGLFVKEKQ